MGTGRGGVGDRGWELGWVWGFGGGMLWGAQRMAGDKDLTGCPRALSAGPGTAPPAPAALAAAPSPPAAAAAAPAPAPHPAPAPLRDRGDSVVTPTPQTRRARSPKGVRLRDPSCGVTGDLYPMLLLPGDRQMDAGDGQRDAGDGQADAGDRQTSPCRASLPWVSSARSCRRATTSSPSAVTLTSSLAWGEGTRWCGDRGGTVSSGLSILCQSLVPPHHRPTSPSCPQAPGGSTSPHHVSQRGRDVDLGKILLSQRDAHPGEDAGAPRMSQVTQAPRGWHPQCQGGDRGHPSCVPHGCTAQPHSQPHSREAGAFFQPLQTIVRPDEPGGAAGPGSSSGLWPRHRGRALSQPGRQLKIPVRREPAAPHRPPRLLWDR